MSQITCPKCGKAVPFGAHVCPYCMVEIGRCPSCGTVSAGVSACPNCGTALRVQPKPVQGKKFAIPAFILAMVALSFFISALITAVEIEAMKEMLHEMSTSSITYYLANEDFLDMLTKVDYVMGVAVAATSVILCILAWVKLSGDLKGGLHPKTFVVLTAIASAVSVAMLIANGSMLF